MGMEEAGPDRGWSWVVVFAACFNSLVLAGIFRTSGVLFVAFIATFGVSREEAAWPMGVCISVLNFIGPLSGVLGQRFGVRPVVMAGAVIGAAGLAACYFTTSLLVITVLFGGVFGIGYGFVNTLMPVIVNAYFLDLRGTANGIANSGSCFGSIILPVLFEFLMSKYDLSGCFLLTGGLVLNVAVAGALMRPPAWNTPYHREKVNSDKLFPRTSEDKPTHSPETHRPSLFRSISDFQKSPVSNKAAYKINITDCSIKDVHPNGFGPLDPNCSPMKNFQEELANTLSKRSTLQVTELQNFSEELYNSLDTSSSSIFERKDSVQDRLQCELRRAQEEFEDTLSDFQNVALEIVETSKSEEVLNRNNANGLKTSELTDNCPARHSFSVLSAKRSPHKFKSPIPSSGPLKKYSFRLRNSSGDSDLYPVSENVNKEDLTCQSEVPTENSEKARKELQRNLPSEIILPVTLRDDRPPTASKTFSAVLSSPMFYVTAFSNVTFYFLFHMYVNVVIDYSLDQGVAEEDAKYILFAFAMSDLFGRLCLGWVTDKKILTRNHFVMSGMIGIGVVFFSLPFANDYWSLVLVSCCYGVLLGSTMVIFPIILVDLLGMEMHAIAYGCMCFMNGFTSLIRPVIIGYYRDKQRDYHNMFFVLGIVSVVASLSWLLEKCFMPKNHPESLYRPISDKAETT